MEQEEAGALLNKRQPRKMAKPYPARHCIVGAVTVKTQHVSRNVTQIILTKLYLSSLKMDNLCSSVSMEK